MEDAMKNISVRMKDETLVFIPVFVVARPILKLANWPGASAS